MFEQQQTHSVRVAGVDSLRAIAVIAVFVCHINQYWLWLELPGKLPKLAALGAHGVDLFIVISGFCLALPVLSSGLRLNLKKFAGRRALRILPAYWLALSIATIFAMLPATYSSVVASRATWFDFGVHLFAAQTWVGSTLGTINGSLWSVSLEIQLYIVLPLLVLLWRRFGFGRVLAAAAVLSFGWELLALWESARLALPVLASPYVLPDRLVQFCAGAFCAYVLYKKLVPNVRTLTGILIVGALVATALSTADIIIGHAVTWAVPSAAAVLLVAGRAGAVLARTPLNALGRVSYSFYLLHQPILLLLAAPLAHLPGGWPAQLMLGGVIAFVIASGAGWMLFRLVELPSHRLGQRIFARGVRMSSRDDSLAVWKAK